MVSAVCGGIRVASIYAPNGRVVNSPFYQGKLRWFERLTAWATGMVGADGGLIIGGDFNVAPTDDDVWSAPAAHGGTHVSEPERAALAGLRGAGLSDAYRAHEAARGRFSWWDYRAGMFHKNQGMRIDLLYVTPGHRRQGHLGRDRSRGTQGPADPLGSCAGGHRPGYAGHAVRCRLGRCHVPRRGPNESPHPELSAAAALAAASKRFFAISEWFLPVSVVSGPPERARDALLSRIAHSPCGYGPVRVRRLTDTPLHVL